MEECVKRTEIIISQGGGEIIIIISFSERFIHLFVGFTEVLEAGRTKSISLKIGPFIERGERVVTKDGGDIASFRNGDVTTLSGVDSRFAVDDRVEILKKCKNSRNVRQEEVGDSFAHKGVTAWGAGARWDGGKDQTIRLVFWLR